MEVFGRRTNVWLALMFSLLCLMLTGIDMAFNVYALLLKETFQFSQTQVEIVASTGTVGLALTFLEPLLTGTLGYRATFVVTFLVNPLSSGFLACTALFSDYFYSRPLYIYTLHLVMCTSYTMSSVCLVGANVKIFPKEHVGKMIGIMSSFICLGKVTFGGLVEFLFPTNLAGFFLTISSASVICFGICYTLLYRIVTSLEYGREVGNNEIQQSTIVVEKGEGGHKNGLQQNVTDDTNSLCTRSYDDTKRLCQRTSDNNLSKQTDGIRLSSDNSLSKQTIDNSLSKQALPTNNNDISNMLHSRFFHLTIWPAIVFYACAYTCMNNITSISASAQIGNSMSPVYVMAVVIMVVRAGCGIIFDKLASELWILSLILLGHLTFAFGLIIGMLWLESPVAVYSLTILTGIGMGSGMTVPISVIVMRFGRNKYQITMGIFYIFSSLIQIILQLMIGALYDYNREATNVLDLSCFGTGCFYWSFVILLGLTSAMTIVQFINLSITYLNKSKN